MFLVQRWPIGLIASNNRRWDNSLGRASDCRSTSLKALHNNCTFSLKDSRNSGFSTEVFRNSVFEVSVRLWFWDGFHCVILPPHPCETVHDADTRWKLRGNQSIQSSEHGWKAEEHQVLHIEELDEGQGQTACEAKEEEFYTNIKLIIDHSSDLKKLHKSPNIFKDMKGL